MGVFLMIPVDGFSYTVADEPCYQGAQSFIFRLEPVGASASSINYLCVVPKPYDINQPSSLNAAAVYKRITGLDAVARYPFLPKYLSLTKEQQCSIGREKMAWVYDLLDENDDDPQIPINQGWCQAFSDILIVEEINGVTLAAYLEQNPQSSLEDRLLIFLKVYEAVERMHTQLSIVHGDLSLDNIMLREDGSVVFIDFGKSERLSHQPFFCNNNAAQSKDALGLFELFYELVTLQQILSVIQGGSAANSESVKRQLLFDGNGVLRPLSKSCDGSLLDHLQPLYEGLYQQSQSSGKISWLCPERYLRQLYLLHPRWQKPESLAVHLEKNIGYMALWVGQSTGFKMLVVAASIVALGLLTAQFWLPSTYLLPLLIQALLPFMSQAGAILSVMTVAVVGLKLYYDGAYQQYLDQRQYNALYVNS